MAKAVFAGTFDPFTIGHLDIVNKASKMFDEVYIVIDSKSDRSYDAKKMEMAIEEACIEAGLHNCYAAILPSYMNVIEYAEHAEAEFLVRACNRFGQYLVPEAVRKIF